MAILTLPDRPLKLARKAKPRYVGTIVAALLVIGLGAFFLFWQLPGLQRDWKISSNPVLVPDGTVSNGECTTRKGILTDCKAHLSYVVNGTSYDREVEVMFVDFNRGDYWVDIVRSGDDPALATMSIGIDKLWNRTIVLGVFLLLLLGGGLWALWIGARNMRAAGQMSPAARLVALPAVITQATTTGKNTNVSFRNPEGPRPKAKFVSVFGKGEEPLVVRGPDGSAAGVAVTHPGTSIPVLLDVGLLRLDLTAEEREAAFASVRT